MFVRARSWSRPLTRFKVKLADPSMFLTFQGQTRGSVNVSNVISALVKGFGEFDMLAPSAVRHAHLVNRKY
jgi:hypothetical protein